MIDELKAHVCRRLRIALALIYGRPPRAAAAPVTDLGDYLARKRDRPPGDDQAEPWPQVPRSHPLRFRYDCWRELEPYTFARVERRLFGCMTMLGGWCRSTDPSRRPEIERAYRVLIEADDPELAYVRRCGAELALMTHQIPALRAAPLSLRPHPVPAREIDAAHAYTYPARAGYELTDAWLTEKIKQIHAENRKVYGSPRIHAELRMAHGVEVGRKRVERLMAQAGISGLVYRKRGRTTIRVQGDRRAARSWGTAATQTPAYSGRRHDRPPGRRAQANIE